MTLYNCLNNQKTPEITTQKKILEKTQEKPPQIKTQEKTEIIKKIYITQ